MTDITPATAMIQEEAVNFRSAVSQSVGYAMGGAINYCLTTIPTLATQASLNAVSTHAGVSQTPATFPYSGNRSLKTRLDEVIGEINADYIITDTFVPPASPYVPGTLRDFMGYNSTTNTNNFTCIGTTSGTTWKLEKYSQNAAAGNIVITELADTFVSTTDYPLFRISYAATTSNLFIHVEFYRLELNVLGS